MLYLYTRPAGSDEIRPTYRERRMAKAERLAEWAAKREAKATAASEAAHAIADMIPVGQPILSGHHSEGRHRRDLARMGAGMDRAAECSAKAADMARRAVGIEAAAARAIYSDDPDAIERLEERIVALEAEREAHKSENAEFRRAHRAELKKMTPFQRSQVLPHSLTNLTGNITRQRERLAQLRRERGES